MDDTHTRQHMNEYASNMRVTLSYNFFSRQISYNIHVHMNLLLIIFTKYLAISVFVSQTTSLL